MYQFKAQPYVPKLKKRRCNAYRPNGEPRLFYNGTLGCRLGPRCTYVHPDEPNWATASASPPPHPSLLHPDEADPPKPSPHPSASVAGSSGLSRPGPLPLVPPPPTAPRVLRTQGTSSTHNPPPDRDREREEEMRAARLHRGPSPTPSIASSSGSRARRPSYVASGARWRDEDGEIVEDRRSYRDEPRKRGDERRYDDRSRERGGRREDDDYASSYGHRRGDDRSRDRRSRSGSRTRRRHSYSRERDGQQSAAATTPPKKELTAEEKRALWQSRVQLLAKAVVAHNEFVRLSEDLQKYKRLAKSSQYQHMQQEDRDALQKLIATAASRTEEKQQELNSLAGQLIPEDFWPFAARAQQAADPGYLQMTEVLASLKSTVDELHLSIAKVQASGSSTAAPAASSAADSKPEPGEVPSDQTDRPKKRRRLSVDEGVQIPDDLSFADLEKLQDHIAALAHRQSDLQNNMLQYDRKVEDEVEAQLDYKLASLRIGVGGDGDRLADEETQKKVEKLSQDVALAQSRTAQAEAELAQLQSYGQTRDEKNESLEQENEKLRERLTELREKQKEMSDTVSEQNKEIRALSAAITTYISRPPIPPLPPGPLTAEGIVEAIRPRLLAAARDELLPTLEEVRDHVQKQLQQQSSEVSGELMAQMAPVVRSIEWISAWIERLNTPSGPVRLSNGASVGTASADKGKGIAR